ncbi:MAG: carbohydrate-binding protein [Ruminococcus sp.]|nr:carbohydrate-binding protein [Ruminococcus sp.]
MKNKKLLGRLASSALALSMTAGAVLSAAPVLVPQQAAAVSSAQRVRVDINRNDGRSALYAPNAETWIYDGSAFTTSTGVKITISNGSGSGSLDVTNNKKLQKYDGTTPYIIADGIYNKDNDSSGALKIEISGLSNGTHSFSGWHSCLYGNVTPSTLKISVNGSVKQTGISCPVNITKDDDAGRSYVEFSGTSATILIQGEGNKSYSNAWLNGFEIDGASPFASISKYTPEDQSRHNDISSGLSWTAGSGAASHDVYIGTDFNSVFNATKSSAEYKGTVSKPHFDLDDTYSSVPTYYWRVDEVSSGGTVKGAVYSFQLNRLAFPTAEGYGRYARGGRGGDVYHVTNLNDSGAGSLRYGLENVTGPRTIVFDVGGIIELKSKLTVPDSGGDVYIAGQTAPGDGITLTQWGFGMLGCDDVIVRDIRVRPGDRGLSGVNDVSDGMGLSSSNHCIIDHCSISWSTDEGFSSRSASNITFQWNVIGEALHDSIHYNASDRTKTETHAFAGSISGNIGSFHHNLLINCTGRNWSLAGGMEQDGVTYGGAVDIRNNVVYNWRDRTTDGGVRRLNFVNNYYKAGAVSNTGLHVVSIDGNELNTGDCQKMYVSGNVMTKTDGSYILKASDDAWSNGKATSNLYNCTINDVKLTSPFCESYINTDSAEDAYKKVTNTASGAGANVPSLDYIDSRYYKEITTGTYTYTGSKQGLKGIIDSQKDVGGYPTSSNFKGGTAAKDSDGDGMPDTWENEHGLDPNNKADGAIVSLSGDDYTNLEMYLNELAGDPVEFNGGPIAEPVSAFETIEAEEYTTESGTRNEDGTDETHVAYIENGDYICFGNVDFGAGARSFSAKVTGNASQIALYTDNMNGDPIAVVDFEGTGGWSSWTDLSANIPLVTGKHKLYLVFRGGEGYLMNIDNFVFGTTMNGKLMTNVSIAATANSASYLMAENAAVGSKLFADRDFTFTVLPDELTGAEQILTSCNDKAETGEVITFTAAEDISVYVAADERLENIPAFLSSYTKTGQQAVSSNDVKFDLYKLDVPAGQTVTISGNGQSYNVVNYTVLAVVQAKEPETTTTTTVTTTTTTTTPAATTAATESATAAETTATAAVTTAPVTTDTAETLYGDANVDTKVNMADAVAVLQCLANESKYPLTDKGKENADCDGSVGLTGNDAIAIQMCDAGMVTLPLTPAGQ